MELTLKNAPGNKRIYEMMIEELDERIQGIIRHLPARIAAKTLLHLRRTAPTDIPGYPKMLKLRQFMIPDVASAVGIVAPGYAHSQRLRAVDLNQTVIYVRPKLVGGEADPSAVVLWRRNPWTMDTLPYEPDRPTASLVSRRVTEREVRAIRAMRKDDMSEVLAQLKKLGTTAGRNHNVLLSRRVTRDLAFEVLRREFGLADTPHVAHWRPAIRMAQRVFLEQEMKRLLSWVTNPAEKRWSRPVSIKLEKISTAKRIQDFQKYVAVRTTA